MRIFPSLLIAAGIAAAPATWHYSQTVFPLPVTVAPAQDDGQALSALRERLVRLEARVDALDARSALGLAQQDRAPLPEDQNEAASDSLQDSFAQVVLIAARRQANEGLTHASSRFLKDFIGLPRADLSDDCQAATNPKLKELLATEVWARSARAWCVPL